MTLSTYPISNGLPAFNLGPSFLEYAIQREMKMSESKHTYRGCYKKALAAIAKAEGRP